MDSERKVSQVFNSNPRGSRLKGKSKTDGGTVYKQILINAKLPEMTGRSPLSRRRSAWDCTAIKE
jgi:hypothetical protein